MKVIAKNLATYEQSTPSSNPRHCDVENAREIDTAPTFANVPCNRGVYFMLIRDRHDDMLIFERLCKRRTAMSRCVWLLALTFWVAFPTLKCHAGGNVVNGAVVLCQKIPREWFKLFEMKSLMKETEIRLKESQESIRKMEERRRGFWLQRQGGIDPFMADPSMWNEEARKKFDEMMKEFNSETTRK